MKYHQHIATGKLAQIVKCFWSIESVEAESVPQKIIPDGYPELIFHFGHPFEINLAGRWERQGMNLLAGQIKHHFQLRNTGKIGIFAIKLQPWALRELFAIDTAQLIHRVIDLPDEQLVQWSELRKVAISKNSFEEKVRIVSSLLHQVEMKQSLGSEAVRLILEAHGMISIRDVLGKIGLSERSLERYFKVHLGVSPKFYSRIIRLSYIFRLAEENHKNWAQIAYQAGFYDQTHFIKNFKEFTGEHPSKYGFDEKNMANFFLK